MASINITILQTVADGLKELKDELVFIGGSVAELYANDPAASDIRPTLDVDCINELRSGWHMLNWKRTLEKKGLQMTPQKMPLYADGFTKKLR
jgi:hypothetical protein